MNSAMKTIVLSILLLLVVSCAGGAEQATASVNPAKVITPSIETQNTATVEALPAHTATPVFTNTPTMTSPAEIRKTNSVEMLATPTRLVFPPYPQEVIENGGTLLLDDFILVFIKKADHREGWFGERIYHKKQWVLLDTFIIPPMNENEIIMYEGCYLDGNLDNEIVAIGVLDDDAYLKRFVPNKNVLYAWRLNKQEKIVEFLDIEGIECSAETSVYWKD